MIYYFNIVREDLNGTDELRETLKEVSVEGQVKKGLGSYLGLQVYLFCVIGGCFGALRAEQPHARMFAPIPRTTSVNSNFFIRIPFYRRGLYMSTLFSLP